MIRVLIIGFYGSRGGIESSVMNYYRLLDHTRVQYDFVNPYESFYFKDEIINLGGVIYDVTSFRHNPIGYMVQIRRIIKENNYKVVNLQMLSAINLFALFAVRLAGVKNVIAHAHSAGAKSILKHVVHVINKPLLNMLVSHKWACSEMAAKWLFWGKRRIVNNAINLATYSYDYNSRSRIRSEMGISDRYVIGTVGRLSREKNYLFLIDTFARYYEKNPRALLMIVGGGQEYDELRKHADSLGVLGSGVLLVGDRSDVPTMYSVFDTFVLTSLFEGLPVVGVEAQAAGLPVIFSENITTEVDIAKQIQYVSLEASYEVWAGAIETARGAARKDYSKELSLGGYNIKIEAKKIQDLYLDMGLNTCNE